MTIYNYIKSIIMPYSSEVMSCREFVVVVIIGHDPEIV